MGTYLLLPSSDQISFLQSGLSNYSQIAERELASRAIGRVSLVGQRETVGE